MGAQRCLLLGKEGEAFRGGVGVERALHVHGIDITAPQRRRLGGPLAFVLRGGYVNERGVVKCESGAGERALEAARTDWFQSQARSCARAPEILLLSPAERRPPMP
ncbi:hypothetical protein [Streptomyces sp. NPDC002785]|uniref:hypothetical protein n=1 Tax=Streptomyces sp. NPDC002785 TaxID=3154543 RepID=UPI003321D85D